MKQNLKSNIWKYTLVLISNKRIFLAIIGAYYLTIAGVEAKEIGYILLAGNLTGFLLEIPSGYISDKLGHKKALVLSRVLMLLSTFFFLLANNIWLLILGSSFLSMSHAFLSGTGSAFLHETLKALKRDKDYTQVMGKIRSVGFGVPVVFMVLIPFLVDISYKAPFIVSLVTDLIGLIAALSLIKPPVTQEKIEEVGITNFRQVISEGKSKKFFRLAIFSGLTSGFFFAIGIFRAPYQVFLSIPVIYYGVFVGIGRVLASVLLAFSGQIKSKLSMNKFYGTRMIFYFLLIILLGLIGNPTVAVILLLLINGFQWGFSQISNGYQLDIIKNSSFKATLLSVRGQFYLLSGGVLSLILGFAIDKLSYQNSFLYFSIFYILVLLPLYLIIYKTKYN